jgi:hypothetical protein
MGVSMIELGKVFAVPALYFLMLAKSIPLISVELIPLTFATIAAASDNVPVPALYFFTRARSIPLIISAATTKQRVIPIW